MHPKTMSHWFVPLVLVLFTMQWVLEVLAVNVLVGTNSVVNPKQYLTSANGQYSLVMRPDCNLVVYNDSQPFVGTNFSNHAHTPNCSLWMQHDGNLVIYNFTEDNGKLTRNNALWALWDVTQKIEAQSFLLLGDDGSSAFYDSNSSRIQNNNLFDAIQEWFGNVSGLNYSDFQVSSNTDYTAWKPKNSLADFPYMPVSYFLPTGKKLETLNFVFTLELGTDCNLQSKSNVDEGLWESKSTKTDNSVCQLVLQPNGSLQILDVNSSAIWSSPGSGVSGINWILKGNVTEGVWSISEITNTSNVLWKIVRFAQLSRSGKSSITLISSAVAGGAGGVIVLALTVLGLYFYARERFLDPAEKAFQARLRAKGGTSYAFSRAKIKQATKNYENMIGSGGFGVVYKGKLSDGREVAAKVLSANSHQSKQEFFNEVVSELNIGPLSILQTTKINLSSNFLENQAQSGLMSSQEKMLLPDKQVNMSIVLLQIELLSMVHHKYLVSLVGFSCTRTHQVLVYEFMGGGDLRHRLQGESSAENPLSWRQRTIIVLQVAEGLEYLHEKCSPPIIHRDVKSTNILLTDQLVAKVADFGLSKLTQENATHVTTLVKGTPGYLDPEYHETGMLTEKSDVYAFGVVLMEILTGRPHMCLAQKVGEAWREEQVDGLADPNLKDDFEGAELLSLVELALWCARRRSAERPVMNQVVRRLYDLGLGGTSLRDGIDLGDECEAHTINVELVVMALEDLDSETQRIFFQQYAH